MSGKSTRAANESDAPDRRRAKDSSRRSKIAIVAYYKAQRRGFRSSGELEEWLSAQQAAESGANAAGASSETTRAKGQNEHDAKKQ